MIESTFRDGRAGIDAALVKRLVAAQFPRWRELPVTPVEVDGWDNRTYRLGDDMTVRLPTAVHYTPAVSKEDRWLPILIPVPLARGRRARDTRSTGRSATGSTVSRRVRNSSTTCPGSRSRWPSSCSPLQRIDATDGPAATAHSFYRGAPPAHYDEQTRHCLDRLTGRIDTARAAAVWDAALEAAWDGPPV